MQRQEQLSLMQLGYSYFERGHMEQAQTVFRGLVTLDANVCYAWYMLALIAESKQDSQRALGCAEQALSVLRTVQDTQGIHVALYLVAAKHAAELGQLDKAQAYWTQVLVDDRATSGQQGQARAMVKRHRSQR